MAPTGPIVGGEAFSTEITPSVSLTEAFIAGVLEVLTLEEVTVQAGQATITARSGATGADVVSVLPGTPFSQNILDDPDNDGIPGPITITFETVTGNYVAVASGNVVFDFVGDPQSVPAPSATGLATQILGISSMWACRVARAHSPTSAENSCRRSYPIRIRT